MAKAERKSLIADLQALRKSQVICYLTSTRVNSEVTMALDAVFKINEHAKSLVFPKGEKRRIDLFLYSNGGDSTVPWRLVTLLREYCDELNVLIPYRAYSAATLTALGADSIVMHRMGVLGPVDPTVSNAFNPKAPNGNPIGISVEDVSAYIALIKEDASITGENQLVLAFNKLADQVHPLALGNVKRHISQSRMMARKLLCLHMNSDADEQIKRIVENLTSKSYYHSHPINRKEAKEQIGIQTVQYATEVEEKLMWSLYEDFDRDLRNEEPFSLIEEYLANFPNPTGAPVDIGPIKTRKVAFVQSFQGSDVSIVESQITGSRPAAGGISGVQLHT